MIGQGWDARALAGGFNAWREKYAVEDLAAETA